MEQELAGGVAWVKLPYGEFVIDPHSDAVLFAGGTGVTAFTAFLQSLQPAETSRVLLFYGARTPDLFVYATWPRHAPRRPGPDCRLVCEQTMAGLTPPPGRTFAPARPRLLPLRSAADAGRSDRRSYAGVAWPRGDPHRCLGLTPAPSAARSRPCPRAHQGLWEDLRGARLFVTGGTGFFGRWMLESLRTPTRLSLEPRRPCSLALPVGFGGRRRTSPRQRAMALDQRRRARRSTGLAGGFTHVLHLATQSEPGRVAVARVRLRDGRRGHRARARLRRSRAAPRRLLLTSSGAVYGPQPPDMQRLDEDYPGAPRPEDASAGYGHGKRAAECSVRRGSG